MVNIRVTTLIHYYTVTNGSKQKLHHPGSTSLFGSLTAVANLDIALFISDILQYTFSIFICNHGLTITVFFIDFSG